MTDPFNPDQPTTPEYEPGGAEPMGVPTPDEAPQTTPLDLPGDGRAVDTAT